MERWKDAAVIIGIFATAVGMIGGLVGIAKIIRDGGRREARLSAEIGELKEGQAASREKQEKILDTLSRHVTDSGVHVNPLVEQRMYEEDKEWRRRVETKLDSLTAGGKG